MNSRSKALINYYTRLVQKGSYQIEDVPEYIRDTVSKLLEASKAIGTTETK